MHIKIETAFSIADDFYPYSAFKEHKVDSYTRIINEDRLTQKHSDKPRTLVLFAQFLADVAHLNGKSLHSYLSWVQPLPLHIACNDEDIKELSGYIAFFPGDTEEMNKLMRLIIRRYKKHRKMLQSHKG